MLGVSIDLVVFFLSSPSYTSKVPEQRLDESNVGHQMLKKMGGLDRDFEQHLDSRLRDS